MATVEGSRDDGTPALEWVLPYWARVSRRVGVMTDDDDGVTSASGLSGSLSLCLASLSLCLTPHYLSVPFFFFFLSSVPFSLSS